MNATDQIRSTLINATNDLCRQHGIAPVMRRQRGVQNRETLVYFENSTFGEGDYKVEYDYTPEDRETGSGHEIALCSVMVINGNGWLEVLPVLCDAERDRIETYIAENMEY